MYFLFDREEKVSKKDQLDRLNSFTEGFLGTLVMYVGLRTGLLKTIRAYEKGIKMDELVKVTGMQRNYVEAWCRAAYSFELLDYTLAEGFILTPHLNDLLLNDKDPFYVGGMPLLIVEMSRHILKLPDLFEKGGEVHQSEYGEDFFEAVLEASKPLYNLMIREVMLGVEGIRNKLEKRSRLLEVGFGAGYGLIAVAETFPLCQVFGVDPHRSAIEKAQTFINTRSLQNRIHIEPESGENLQFKEQFDVALIQQALHECQKPQKVLENVRASLKPDGILILVEHATPEGIENSRGLLNQIHLGINLIFEEPLGSKVLSPDALTSMLIRIGFLEVKKVSINDPRRFVLIAKK